MKSTILVITAFGFVFQVIVTTPQESEVPSPAVVTETNLTSSASASTGSEPESESVTNGTSTPKSAPTSSTLETGSKSADSESRRLEHLPPDDAPDWVREEPQLHGGHVFTIWTTESPDLEGCREEFDAILLPQVQKHLDEHVLRHVQAKNLSELTKEYIEKYWLVEGKEFDDISERPTGAHHRLWKQIHITESQIDTVRDWENRIVVSQRTKHVGLAGAATLAGMTLLSGMIGLLARREEAKLKG